MIKKKIAKNWHIVRPIHSGSFGSVYKIKHRKTGQDAALKIIHPQFEMIKEILKSAFEAAANISHQNCVGMIEWIESEAEFGFIMEFVEGNNLLSLQRSSFSEIIEKFIGICDGLNAFHSAGVIHRDLKPENILIDRSGTIKIMDFDFIQDKKSQLSENNMFYGSAKYSSPEQFLDSEDIDIRSDLYSVGIILYEIIGGKTPFSGESWQEIAKKHLEQPVDFQKIENNIPESILSILKKLLQKNPEKRYKSAMDLKTALETYLAENTSKSPKKTFSKKELQQKISKYPDEEIAVLQKAAIIGEKSSCGILREFFKTDELEKILSKSQEKDLLEFPNKNKIIFRKNVRNILLQNMPEEQKFKGREELQKVLEIHFQNGENQYLEDLASVNFEAHKFENAFKYLKILTDESIKQKNFETAITSYDKIIYIIENTIVEDRELKLTKYLLKLVEILQQTKKWDQAEDTLKKALDLSLEIENQDYRLQCYENLCRQNFIRRRFNDSLEYCLLAAEISLKTGNKLKHSRAMGNLGNILQKLNRNEEAIDYYRKQQKLSEELDREEDVSKAFGNIGFVYFYMGKIDEAEKCYREYYKRSKKLNSKQDVCVANGHLGRIYLEKGMFERALEFYDQQLKFANDLKDKHFQSLALGNMGIIYKKQGKFQEALESYEMQLFLDEEIKHIRGICIACSNIANIYKRLNLFSKAEKLYRKAIDLARKHDLNEYLPSFLHNNADLFFKTGRIPDSISFNKEASELALKMNRQKTIIDCLILETKIAFQKENNEFIKNECLSKLYKTLSDCKNDEFSAKINYKLFKFIGSEVHRLKAISLYTGLLIKTNNFEFKEIINELENAQITGRDSSSLGLVSSLVNLMNPESAYAELLKFLTKECNADNCQIVSYNNDLKRLETMVASPGLAASDLDFSHSILLDSIKRNKAFYLPNAVESTDFQDSKSIMERAFLSVISVPVELGKNWKGALYLERRHLDLGAFRDEDFEKAKTISGIISPVIIKQEEFIQNKARSEVQKYSLFIGDSRKMLELYKNIYKASQVDSSVYIFGESGTGKELVAKALKNLSIRKTGRFVALNCAAIPHELAESELFGYEKGAFTGADSLRKGKFEQADQGVLFLDEIGELPLNIQAKLLRVLEEHEITRLGGQQVIPIDVRIIVATQKDLEKEVQNGNFRNDLLHRLNILRITVPTLRERKEDIPILAERFLRLFSEQYNKDIPGFSEQALNDLQKADWIANNVRELKNTIERTIVQHQGNEPISAIEFYQKQEPETSLIFDRIKIDPNEKLDDHLRKVESRIIYETLQKNNWNKLKTSNELKIGRPRLDRIIKANDWKK